jgi:dihydropteroate synthase
VVWVTDGQVTDSHDHPDEALAAACASLVRRHGIRLARDLTEAANALRTNRPLTRSRCSEFGRVGRKLLENNGF